MPQLLHGKGYILDLFIYTSKNCSTNFLAIITVCRVSNHVPERAGMLGSGTLISSGTMMGGMGNSTLSSSDPHLLFFFRLTGGDCVS